MNRPPRLPTILARPDDETLRCGATLAPLARQRGLLGTEHLQRAAARTTPGIMLTLALAGARNSCPPVPGR